MTAPFVPMLFQGEEWGASTPFRYFTDHTAPELADAVRSGRRKEFEQFGWDPAQIPDPQDAKTFRRSRLDWDEVERAPHAATLAFYRELIALRRREPDLRDGRLDRVVVSFDEARGWIRVVRGAVTVCANLRNQEVSLPPPSGALVLATAPPRYLPGELLVLAPQSAAIFV
jgi:maltooligosyltrehalose trehalohydrolase